MFESLNSHDGNSCSCLFCVAGSVFSDAGRAFATVSANMTGVRMPPKMKRSTTEARKPICAPEPSMPIGVPGCTSDALWHRPQLQGSCLKSEPCVAITPDAAVSVLSLPCDVPRSLSDSLSPSPPSLSPPSQFSGPLSPRSLLFRAGADEGGSSFNRSQPMQPHTEIPYPSIHLQMLRLRDGEEGSNVSHNVKEMTEDTERMSSSMVLQSSRVRPMIRRRHSEGSLHMRFSPSSDSTVQTPVESPSSPATPQDTDNGTSSWNTSPPHPPSHMVNDFSAYVSGIGQPVDPDTELSSVVQLQAFRMNSRSRSVGPGYQRSPRMHQYVDADRYRLRKQYSLASPPRPPMFIHDTLDIEPLPPAVVPAPKAEPSSPVPVPVADEQVPDIPALDSAPEADDDGFRKALPQQHKRRCRASRPRAEEPEPLDLSAFADREHHGEEEEERGRGRSRNRTRTSDRRRTAAGESWSSRNGLPPNAIIQSSPLKAQPVGAARARFAGMSFAEAVAQDAREVRGRQEGVKPVTSSARSDASASDDEALVRGDANTLTRTRLLSNGGHLLMLSLELAMMRNKKINAPLRPRWGKRRDDDFCPIASPMINPRDGSACINGSPLRHCWAA